MKSSTYKLVSILLPFVAVFLGGLLIMLQFRRLRTVEEQRDHTIRQIAFLDQLSRDMQAHPALRKLAVAPAAPNEQPLFLNVLRGYADLSRVQLVRYENRTAPPPPAGSNEAKTDAFPPGVKALTSSVEVTGDYYAIRQFLYQLLHSPRLYNTTDLKWAIDDRGNGAKWPITHLTFTLSRYITAPIPPGENTRPPSSDTPGGGGGRS